MTSRDHLRRFQFIREIATGGFGSVYLTKVMHADGFSRLVAVKLLKAQWSDSEEVARRMRDEARLLGLLRHRNIVDVIDLTSIDGRAAVIMEYLEAVDLRTVVQHLAATGQRLPVRAGLDIASAAASALDAAYNRPPIPGDKPLRVIHRDIKPSNLMVDDNGMLKVLDFGVARSEIDNRESHTQELQFGSVDYMAPERLFFEPETPASDVYSLAATVFEVLALEKLGKARGRPARHATYITDRLSFLRASLGLGSSAGTELEALLGSALAFDHEDRPTAAEFHRRARGLARMVDDEDLGSWAERVLPPVIRENQDAPRAPSTLVDSIMVEDARELAEDALSEDGHSSGDMQVLRHGALSEMDDTGAFVPNPPTGAPAQLQSLGLEPDPEDDWSDGPTAASASLRDAVRVRRPHNAENARRAQTAPPRRAAEPADPAAPIANMVARRPLGHRPPDDVHAEATQSAEPVPAVHTEVEEATVPSVPLVPVAAGLESASTEASSELVDPAAPVAHAPLPPLPAPPGVTPRPLAPVLPVPVAVVEEGPQAPVVQPPVVPSSTGRTIVPDYDSFEDASELDATVVDDTPLSELLARRDEPMASPPVLPTPAEIGLGSVDPEPAVPDLDEVVPQSSDSRYAPELAALESQPVAPPVEPESAPEVAPVHSESAPEVAPVHTESVAAPAPPARSRTPLFAAAGCFVFLLIGGAAGVGAWALGLVGADGGQAEVAAGEAAPEPPAVAEAGDTAAPAADLPDGIVRFTSAASDTKKLQVDCGANHKGSDARAVDVPADGIGACTVKLIRSDRSRAMTAIEAPVAGEYTCFADGSDSCVAP